MKNFHRNFMDCTQSVLGFYVISFNLYVLIRGSSLNPLISYGTSEIDDASLLTQSNLFTISNSTFVFGEIDQNVIQLNSKLDPQFVFIKCEAPYPIRWLATKPLCWATEGSERQSEGFSSCAKNQICAQHLIENYYKKMSGGGEKYDCNKDGILSCEDFFRIHYTNNNDRCVAMDYSEIGYVRSLDGCLLEKKLTFTRLQHQRSDYDPRIGLRVDELPDPAFKYEFNIPWRFKYSGTFVLRPYKSDDRIYSKLYYNNGLKLIHCEITTPGAFEQPNILIGKCDSLSECQLKFEPLWPN
ncbi:unnamed protein product, partial [Allacma fusca]